LVESIIDLYDPNTKIYEAHYGMTQEWAGRLRALGYPADLALSYDRYTGAPDFTLGNLDAQNPGTYHETFHFALNNYVAKDNRIPPYGMSYDKALARNALPVPDNQYNGGPGKTYDYFDTFHLNPPHGAASATIDLLYQPTSYEYQLFILKANNQGNPFLAMEGQYMFEAWLNTGMAAPYVMASATWHDPTVPQCNATTPVMLSAVPSSQEVIVEWQAVDQTVQTIDGYRLYYDQAGKAQLVHDTVNDPDPLGLSFPDTGLTNGQEYCYKVTSYYLYTDPNTGTTTSCESAFSNIICATPDAPGQTVLAGIPEGEMVTVRYVVTGGTKKNPIISFEVATGFTPGEEVVIRATVRDESGVPLSGATVDIAITDITGNLSFNLTTGASDNNGIAEATWQTQAGRRNKPSPDIGTYTATGTNVTATGYSWDGVATETTFLIQ
jgi:hypothetical protein